MGHIKTFVNDKEVKRPSEDILNKYFTKEGHFSKRKSGDRLEELKPKSKNKELNFSSLDRLGQIYSNL